MNHKKVNVIILVLILFVLSGCGKKEVPVSEAEKPFIFKVQFALGDVKVSGASGEKAANPGDSIFVNDTVITGKKAVADLVFGTSGVIRIHENSKVVIASIADNTNSDTVMDMENGRVFLTLTKLKGTGFKVKTPTAVASVRGTSFTVLSDKKGAKLSVVKGTVAVNPVKDGVTIEDKTAAVEAGRKTDYIDKKTVEKIITGKIDIPVMDMTPAEKIEIQSEIKEIKIEEIPDLALELKEEVKPETAAEPVSEIKKEKKYESSFKKEEQDSAINKLAEEKRIKEEEIRKQEEDLKKQVEEKKIKEEKIKKERASNIPTM